MKKADKNSFLRKFLDNYGKPDVKKMNNIGKTPKFSLKKNKKASKIIKPVSSYGK